MRDITDNNTKSMKLLSMTNYKIALLYKIFHYRHGGPHVEVVKHGADGPQTGQTVDRRRAPDADPSAHGKTATDCQKVQDGHR